MPNQYSSNQLNSKLVAFYNQPVAKISIELFLSLGLVILLTVFAIQPTLTTIARLNAEVQQKKEREAQLQTKVAALNTATEAYNRNRSSIALLDQALPSTPKLMATVKTIEKLAGDSNVIVRTMSVRKIPDEGNSAAPLTNTSAVLEDLPVTVTVIGNFADIRSFVEKLHQSRRIIRVLGSSFSVEDSRGQRLLSASLTIDAPYYGNPQ